MKIENIAKEIFAQAVLLDQNGGLRNTIYGIDREIFILNYDHTILLKFDLLKSDDPFETPISFKANDYDSDTFEAKDSKIIFYTKLGDYEKQKICGTTDLTPKEVRELFYTYESPKGDAVSLSKDVLTLLDFDLSHVEFSGKAGKTIRMLQRNIYSGGIIKIEKIAKGMFPETLKHDFGPIAIKTNDLRALFVFNDVLKFSFPSNEGNEDYILVTGGSTGIRKVHGIIACCLYDEIIKLKTIGNGRKEQKVRRRQ